MKFDKNNGKQAFVTDYSEFRKRSFQSVEDTGNVLNSFSFSVIVYRKKIPLFRHDDGAGQEKQLGFVSSILQ